MEDIKTVSFEIAYLAKTKGYNFPTKECYLFGVRRSLSWVKEHNYFYSQCVFLPTVFYLQKWLKEKYNIDVIPTVKFVSSNKKYGYQIYDDKTKISDMNINDIDTMEKAIEIGIKTALQLI